MSEVLRKFMGRFLKKEGFEKTFGSDRVSIDCTASNQRPDLDISIGDATKKALVQLKTERRKSVLLGIRTFYSTSVTYLQSHLPPQNTLHSLESIRMSESFEERKSKQCKGNCNTGKKVATSVGCRQCSR